MYHFITKDPWYSDRAVYSDFNPLDGGQSLYPIMASKGLKLKVGTTAQNYSFFFQPTKKGPRIGKEWYEFGQRNWYMPNCYCISTKIDTIFWFRIDAQCLFQVDPWTQLLSCCPSCTGYVAPLPAPRARLSCNSSRCSCSTEVAGQTPVDRHPPGKTLLFLHILFIATQPSNTIYHERAKLSQQMF